MATPLQSCSSRYATYAGSCIAAEPHLSSCPLLLDTSNTAFGILQFAIKALRDREIRTDIEG